jgi:hypothetical protein
MVAAINAGGASPALALTSSDPRIVPTVLADTGISGDTTLRTHVTVSVDTGALLVTYVDQHISPTTVQLRRITTPSNPAQWTAARSTIATGAFSPAGARIIAAAGLLRCCYQRASDHFPVYRDSTDDGLTWGVETTLGNGTLPLALSAPIITDFVGATPQHIWVVAQAFSGLLQGASQLCLTTQSGAVWSAWVYEDPAIAPGTRGSGQINSIDFIPTNAGTPLSGGLFVAGIQARNTFSGIGVAWWVWNGATHSTSHEIQSNDNPASGISWHAAATGSNSGIGTAYALACYNDDGSVTGTVHTRAALLSRPGSAATTVPWTRICHFDETIPSFGASIVQVGPDLSIVTGRYVWILDTGGPTADMAADLLALHVHEALNGPTTARITLANQDLQYLDPVYPGIHLSLQLGYGTDLVACHTLVVTDYRQLAAGSTLAVQLECLDLASFLLSRISERFMAISEYRVSELAALICSLAGITDFSFSGAEVSNVVPCFIIKPGESYASCLNRLADLYDLVYTTDPTPSVTLSTANALAGTTWDYGQETLAATYGCPADLPTLVRVVGDSPSAWAEAWDSSLIPVYGQYIYQHIADRLITTAAQARARAMQALRVSQRQSRHATLTVTLNPQHTPNDLIRLTDDRLGDAIGWMAAHHFRIEAIDTLITHQDGTWHTTLTLQEP